MGRLAAEPVRASCPAVTSSCTFRLVVSAGPHDAGAWPARHPPSTPSTARPGARPRNDRCGTWQPATSSRCRGALRRRFWRSRRGPVEPQRGGGEPRHPPALAAGPGAGEQRRVAQVSPSSRRRTSPVRGFGPNDVDLRGIRSPVGGDRESPRRPSTGRAAPRCRLLRRAAAGHRRASCTIAHPGAPSGRPATAARAAGRAARSRPATRQRADCDRRQRRSNSATGRVGEQPETATRR